MHELPVIENLCRIVSGEAEKLGAKKVLKITVTQGAYSDYVPEILQQYFELVSEGTAAQGAELEVKTIPAVIFCRECGKESTGDHFRMSCPECGSRETVLRSGKEFYIESIEIEDE